MVSSLRLLVLVATVACFAAAPAAAQSAAIAEACDFPTLAPTEETATFAPTPLVTAAPFNNPCADLVPDASGEVDPNGDCPAICGDGYRLLKPACRNAYAEDATVGKYFRSVFDLCNIDYSASGGAEPTAAAEEPATAEEPVEEPAAAEEPVSDDDSESPVATDTPTASASGDAPTAAPTAEAASTPTAAPTAPPTAAPTQGAAHNAGNVVALAAISCAAFFAALA